MVRCRVHVVEWYDSVFFPGNMVLCWHFYHAQQQHITAQGRYVHSVERRDLFSFYYEILYIVAICSVSFHPVRTANKLYKIEISGVDNNDRLYTANMILWLRIQYAETFFRILKV